jgi:hypothetical protein
MVSSLLFDIGCALMINDLVLCLLGLTGRNDFEKIPTNNTPDTNMMTNMRVLKIDKYITYDEMAISACMSVAVPTYFINSGSRYNSAQKSRADDYQKQGVYVGCVGARLEKMVSHLSTCTG